MSKKTPEDEQGSTPGADPDISTRLRRIPTDLDRVYDELDGPASICDAELPKSTFSSYCNEYPLSDVTSILKHWNDNQDSIRRHWPWVAFAAGHYKFEQKEIEGYENEPTPSEIMRLIQQIDSKADKLVRDLCHLQILACRIDDPTSPHRRSHLAWIFEFLMQNLRSPTPQIDNSPEASLGAWGEWTNLLGKLTQLSAAANAAQSRINDSLLRRSRRQDDPGLYNLTWLLSLVWESLTGRSPSISKAVRNDQEWDEAESSDFMRFTSQIAYLAVGHQPTPDQISTALTTYKNRHRKAG